MVQKVKKIGLEHACERIQAGDQENKDNKNLFNSKKTACNKRLATEIVADWELRKLWSPYGLLLTGGSRECRQPNCADFSFSTFLFNVLASLQ